MSFIKKILSYFYPLTTIVDSDYSGKVEITWYNGKKMLDTENANYSYGSLQEVLEYGIAQVDLTKVHSILILGMGAGSVIKSLREKFNCQKQITTVEWDKSIIEIAASEFGIKTNHQLEIIQRDAVDFVQKNTAKFDLIIIDIFIDNQIPQKILAVDFLIQLPKLFKERGTLIFNMLNVSKVDEQNIISCLQECLEVKVIDVPNHENKLLIASLTRLGKF